LAKKKTPPIWEGEKKEDEKLGKAVEEKESIGKAIRKRGCS